MDPVTTLSLARVALGTGALADPTRTARVFDLDLARNPQVGYVTRLFGSRELALGLATLAATGTARRNLVVLGVVVDAADAVTGYLGVRDGTVTRKAGGSLVVPAVGAVLSGLAGLRRARRRGATTA